MGQIKLPENRIEILKTLVGSRAHGLADKDSDSDYRGVYVVPSATILSLNYKSKGTHWLEGEEKDNTAYELSHFLNLAIHSNPSILEVFVAPVIESNPTGEALRKIFPYVWDSYRAFEAFTGYSRNQRKKMLNETEDRPHKFAVAYIRTLYNLIDLLNKGVFSLEVPEGKQKKFLLRLRIGNYTPGEVIDEAERLTALARRKLQDMEPKKVDYERVNNFLIKTRHKYFYGENK